MAQRKATALAMSNFKRAMNLDFRLNAERMALQTTLPGLSYDDFGRTGIPAIWKLMRSLEVNRFFDIHKSKHAEPEEKESALVVMLGQRLDIKPDFYSYARMISPMLYTLQPSHLGKYSFTPKVIIQNPDSKEILLTNEFTLAGMNIETGKSHPLPPSITETFKAFSSNSKPSPLPTLQLPTNQDYYEYSIRATHSDMDHLFHVNATTYVRYCMDCATEASLSGFTKNITGDPCFLQVSQIETLHSGENFAGDDLNICTWESVTNKNILNFLIFNKNRPNKPVFHCWISFLQPHNS